jgi:hypothetical protein
MRPLDLIPDDRPPATLDPVSVAGLANLGAHSESAGASRILKLRWDLHATQHAFVTSPARFSLFVGGLDSGKTTAGAVRAIVRARDHQGSLGFIGGIV